MTAKTPARMTTDAAESVRALNHATFGPGRNGWRMPSDVYDVIGGLDQMAMMLPQAIGQIAALLTRLADDDHMRSDRGSLDRDLVESLAALEDAHDAAQQLNAALSRAHSATSHLAWED